jgi:hypothetical protein
MRKRSLAFIGSGLVCISGLLAVHLLNGDDKTAAKGEGDAALQRARKQVRMLDDLYKTAVVLITETYVKSESDVSAATAAQLIFEAMKKKEWHEAWLLDATGSPYDDKNVAQDDFDKQAIKTLAEKKQDYVERVESKDGVRYLRAATPIPVVSKKCIICHPHYADAKPGQIIGAISYRLKVE